MWDWGRAITEARDAAMEAEKKGDVEKGKKLRLEYERLLAEHPPSSFHDPIESLERRLAEIERRLGR